MDSKTRALLKDLPTTAVECRDLLRFYAGLITSCEADTQDHTAFLDTLDEVISHLRYRLVVYERITTPSEIDFIIIYERLYPDFVLDHDLKRLEPPSCNDETEEDELSGDESSFNSSAPEDDDKPEFQFENTGVSERHCQLFNNEVPTVILTPADLDAFRAFTGCSASEEVDAEIQDIASEPARVYSYVESRQDAFEPRANKWTNTGNGSIYTAKIDSPTCIYTIRSDIHHPELVKYGAIRSRTAYTPFGKRLVDNSAVTHCDVRSLRLLAACGIDTSLSGDGITYDVPKVKLKTLQSIAIKSSNRKFLESI